MNTGGDRIAPKGSDLDAFSPSPPAKRIDDKAAHLEEAIQGLRSESKKIHFVLSFIAMLFFLLFVGSVANTISVSIAIVACLILLIGLAKWLEFPWVVVNLERWHDLILKYAERKISGKPLEEVEPLPNQDNTTNGTV